MTFAESLSNRLQFLKSRGRDQSNERETGAVTGPDVYYVNPHFMERRITLEGLEGSIAVTDDRRFRVSAEQLAQLSKWSDKSNVEIVSELDTDGTFLVKLVDKR